MIIDFDGDNGAFHDNDLASDIQCCQLLVGDRPLDEFSEKPLHPQSSDPPFFENSFFLHVLLKDGTPLIWDLEGLTILNSNSK